MPKAAVLSDRWALITGASSGIGAEFARQLAARGMHLILTARRVELMQALAAELHTKHGTRTEIVRADLAGDTGVDSLLAEVGKLGHEVELLVNNAGFGIVGEVMETSNDRIQEMLRLNILALTSLTQKSLPAMIARGHGAIINVASVAAFQPVAYMGAYAASKAYVLHYTEAIAAEVAEKGVTVMALCPGITRTDFFDVAGATGWLQKHASSTPEEVVRTALAGLDKGKLYTIPGWKNYFLSLAVRLASRRIAVNESKRFFRPRNSKRT